MEGGGWGVGDTDPKPEQPSILLISYPDHQAVSPPIASSPLLSRVKGGSPGRPPDLRRTGHDCRRYRAPLGRQPLWVQACWRSALHCQLLSEDAQGHRAPKEKALFAQSVCLCLRPASQLDSVPSRLGWWQVALGPKRALCQTPSIRASWWAPQAPVAQGSTSSPSAWGRKAAASLPGSVVLRWPQPSARLPTPIHLTSLAAHS